jgi:hypothetical protein
MYGEAPQLLVASRAAASTEEGYHSINPVILALVARIPANGEIN